jgi:chaperone modulatory protein CbpM
MAKSEEWYYLSLQEVTHSFGVDAKLIIEIVDQGIIILDQPKQEEWRFDAQALKVIHTVLRLQKDLGVNLEGAALAVELLDEIERLKSLLQKQTLL